MIDYEPFWKTLEKKNITQYQLIYHWHISSNTLRRMKHGEPINTTTLNQFCLILDCNIEDIIQFKPNATEIDAVIQRRDEIKERLSKKPRPF